MQTGKRLNTSHQFSCAKSFPPVASSISLPPTEFLKFIQCSVSLKYTLTMWVGVIFNWTHVQCGDDGVVFLECSL